MLKLGIFLGSELLKKQSKKLMWPQRKSPKPDALATLRSKPDKEKSLTTSNETVSNTNVSTKGVKRYTFQGFQREAFWRFLSP